MSDQHKEDDGDYGLVLDTAKPELKEPSLFNVILLNDDYTPMEFVVNVLELYFGMGQEDATRVMLNVHTKGKGVCGSFARDVAETKTAQVNEYARANNHPLLCTMEEVN